MVLRLAPRRQRAREDLGVLPHIHLGALGLRAAQQVEQAGERMRADHHVDPRRPAVDLTLILLGQAPGDHDPHRGVSILEGLQVAERTV